MERQERSLVQISKFLSFLLRHGAEKGEPLTLSPRPRFLCLHRPFLCVFPCSPFKFDSAGLALRNDGYALVKDILALPEARKKQITLEKIRSVVNDNDKQRFTLTKEGTEWLIRANQGHSDAVLISSFLL